MQFVKDNFLSLVVLVLVFIILLQRCGGKSEEPVEPKIIRDTVWVKRDTVVYTKPQLIKSISVESHDTIINHYLPDTNYQKLVLQYQEVVNQLLAKNILHDSVRIDTNGYVKIVDTVQKNLVIGRSVESKIKYPVIKETIIVPPKKVNQVYFGGGIVASKTNSIINQLRFGALFKNKSDQTFLGSVGIGFDGQTYYGLESYWKIKLR